MKQDGIIGGSPVFCRVLPTNIEDIENEEKFTTFGGQAGKCFKWRSSGSYQSLNQFRYYWKKKKNLKLKSRNLVQKRKFFAPNGENTFSHQKGTIFRQF